MSKLKLICFIGFIYTASIAQQSDSTKNQINTSKSIEVVSSIKGEQKFLNKQASIPKKTTTTWTKIKDLFM